MHYQNSQDMVILYIKFSDLNIVDVLLVAEFQESIMDFIPQIITLLKSQESQPKFAANTLAILSEQGKVSKFLT